MMTKEQYYESTRLAQEFYLNTGIYVFCVPSVIEHNYPDNILEEIDKAWYLFMDQPKNTRKMADEKSDELFGLDNIDHYMLLRQKAASQNLNVYYSIPINEEVIKESTNNTQLAIKEARSNIVALVYPVKNTVALQNLIDEYYSMTKSDKALSDSISKKYFNLTNEEHYYKLKHSSNIITEAKDMDTLKTNAMEFAKKYLKKIVVSEPPKAIIETSIKLYNLLESDGNRMIYEERLTAELDDREKEYTEIPNINTLYNDLPYFTADKMIDLGVFSGSNTLVFDTPADNLTLEDGTTVSEWFEAYKNGDYNYLKEHNLARVYTLKRLYSDFDEIKESGDINKINARKQSILELGWDPNVAFSDENRAINDEKIRDFLQKKTKFIDLRGITDDDIPGYMLNKEGDKLYPIYIILVSNNNPVSKAIKLFTGGEISHAAIAFDADLKDAWSFNGALFLYKPKAFGGLSNEPVNIIGNRYIEVYATFINKKNYENLRYALDYIKRNYKKFQFDYIAFLKFLFNIDVDQKSKFVCSSFTDRMLQLANINLRDHDFYKKLVSPMKLRKEVRLNDKFYFLYNGMSDDYNGDEVKKVIEVFSKKAKQYSENALSIEEVSIDYINEINNFNSNTDLTVYNPDIINAQNDKKISNYLNKKTEVIDLRGTSDEDDIPGYEVSNKGDKLYPIYICFAAGNDISSAIIRKATGSSVSHATIGFSSDLDKLYSFNDDPEVMYIKKSKGGLSEESIDYFKKDDLYIEVYVTFVKKKYYENLRYMIDYFKRNADKFDYDTISLIKYIFGFDVDQRDKFVCSSFVDKMLQVAKIDLRDNKNFKKLVSPGQMQKEVRENTKIFYLFSGKSTKYNKNKMKKKIEKLSKEAEFFSEAVSLKLTFKDHKKFPLFFVFYYDKIYLSITPSFNELYYFESQANGSQLAKTSIEDFDNNGIIEVYTCFVEEDRYIKIIDFIKEATAPFYKYTYSQYNILYKLMNINFGTDTPDKMCIEMIDKVIRLSDLVDRKKADDFKLVKDSNLDKIIRRKLDIYGKIYKVYFDRINKYNPLSTELFIASILKQAKPITESFTEGNYFIKSIILEDLLEENDNYKGSPTVFEKILKERN